MPDKKQVAEMNDDFDFDENEELVVDEEETVVDEPVRRKKKKSSLILDDDMREAIIDIVNEETQDIRDEQTKLISRVDKIGKSLKEQAKVTSTLKTQNEAVVRAMARLEGKDVPVLDADDRPVDDSAPEIQQKGVIGKTLGAIGSVAHGVIDTAAFVLESAVDLVTLGNARK